MIGKYILNAKTGPNAGTPSPLPTFWNVLVAFVAADAHVCCCFFGNLICSFTINPHFNPPESNTHPDKHSFNYYSCQCLA